MKIQKDFRADNPGGIAVYAAAAFFCGWMYLEGVLAPFETSLMIGFVVGAALLNGYFWRLELTPEGIRGPGRFGSMKRTLIPWERADVHFGVRQGWFRFLVVRDTGSRRMIKVAEANYSRSTLEELQWHIRHYKNHDAKNAG